MEPPVKKPDLQLLPDKGIIREYVDVMTPTMEIPAESHLACMLVLVSAAIGWRSWIKWGRSSEPVTVWALIEGKSARGKKSSATGSATAIAKDAIARLDYNPLWTPLYAKRMSHTSGPGLLKEVAPESQDQADLWEATVPPGQFWEWDEFGSILGTNKDRKGEGWKGEIRAHLMSMYGGKQGGSNTLANPMLSSKCAVAILGNMTRRELDERVSLGLLQDGFMGRFLLIPSTPTDRKIPRPLPESDEYDKVMSKIEHWLHALISLGSQDMIGHAYDKLTEEAGKVWDEWYIERNDSLADYAEFTNNPDDEAMCNVFGRLQITAMKVALCLAVSEWVPGTPIQQVKIEARHVRYAQALADFSLAELYDIATSGEEPTDPESLYRKSAVEYVQRATEQGKAVTMRLLLKDLGPRGLNPDTRKQAIWSLHPETLDVKATTGNQSVKVSLARPE